MQERFRVPSNQSWIYTAFYRLMFGTVEESGKMWAAGLGVGVGLIPAASLHIQVKAHERLPKHETKDRS
jgi:hypothetical protein